jgi:predicted secreted protein
MFGVHTKLILWGGVALVVFVLGIALSLERGRGDRLNRENADLRATVGSYEDALGACADRAAERARADRIAAEQAAEIAASSVTADFNRGFAVGRAVCQARAS